MSHVSLWLVSELCGFIRTVHCYCFEVISVLPCVDYSLIEEPLQHRFQTMHSRKHKVLSCDKCDEPRETWRGTSDSVVLFINRNTTNCTKKPFIRTFQNAHLHSRKCVIQSRRMVSLLFEGRSQSLQRVNPHPDQWCQTAVLHQHSKSQIFAMTSALWDGADLEIRR